MSKRSINLNFSLADILLKIKLLGLPEGVLNSFIKRHKQFLVEGVETKETIRVIIKVGGKKIFFRQKNSGLPLETKSLIYWTQKDRFSGIIDCQKRQAVFDCAGRLFCLNRVLRFIFAVFNLQRGGLLLHASSVADKGKGYAFFGKEGVGKSTIAKISGAEILSDDSAVIFPINDHFYISTMPFDSKLKKRKMALWPLIIILKLNQAKNNRLFKLKEDSVSAILIHARPNLQFFNKCPKMAARQFGNSVVLAQSVPIKGLNFKKDISFWTIIDDQKNRRNKI